MFEDLKGSSRVDRNIELLFQEVEEGMANLSDLIARRGMEQSSLCWLSYWSRCSHQFTKLLITIYKTEVGLRNPDNSPEMEGP